MYWLPIGQISDIQLLVRKVTPLQEDASQKVMSLNPSSVKVFSCEFFVYVCLYNHLGVVFVNFMRVSCVIVSCEHVDEPQI